MTDISKARKFAEARRLEFLKELTETDSKLTECCSKVGMIQGADKIIEKDDVFASSLMKQIARFAEKHGVNPTVMLILVGGILTSVGIMHLKEIVDSKTVFEVSDTDMAAVLSDIEAKVKANISRG